MPDIEVDISNKTFFVKAQPTFPASDMSTHKTFVSGGQTFSQITIYSDGEVWYGNDTVAYANGEWEIEYRYLTFGANQTMPSSDYDKFAMVYDEYTAGAKKLYFRIGDDGEYKLATLNGKNNGVWDGEPWDNSEVPPEPTGETWLMNEWTQGTIYDGFTVNINFTSNGNSYTQIKELEGELFYGGTRVYGVTGWENQNYRAVYFPEPPTGNLRLWLNANATLQ